MQAPFVTTAEIDKIVEQIKLKYMKWITEDEIYNQELVWILEWKNENMWYSGWWDWDDDELVEQAIEVISSTRKASATLLQRKLWVWFARAARIMDILEERWVVWPQDWAKAREIYI
jgi:S-DNA-T family DNA segregation ATPase FtsK/SpoIIIE